MSDECCNVESCWRTFQPVWNSDQVGNCHVEKQHHKDYNGKEWTQKFHMILNESERWIEGSSE